MKNGSTVSTAARIMKQDHEYHLVFVDEDEDGAVEYVHGQAFFYAHTDGFVASGECPPGNWDAFDQLAKSQFIADLEVALECAKNKSIIKAGEYPGYLGPDEAESR